MEAMEVPSRIGKLADIITLTITIAIAITVTIMMNISNSSFILGLNII